MKVFKILLLLMSGQFMGMGLFFIAIALKPSILTFIINIPLDIGFIIGFFSFMVAYFTFFILLYREDKYEKVEKK